MAAAALILGAIALVVAATTAHHRPTPTNADIPTARACPAFSVAARAVRTESRRDPVLGRLALVNGAGILEAAAGNAAGERADRMRELAEAYRAAAAAASESAAGTADPAWDAASRAVETATDAMQQVCGA